MKAPQRIHKPPTEPHEGWIVEDIYRFRTTVATITDAMIDLIQQKEKVTNAQKWRKRQEEQRAKTGSNMFAEQATERATKQQRK